MSCYGCLEKDFLPCILCLEYKLNFSLVPFQDEDNTIFISNTLNIEEELENDK